MRRVTYQSVLERVAGLWQGTGQDRLDATDAAVARGLAQMAVREYWEGYPWPEWMAVERRTFRPVYDAAATYAAGQEVFLWGTRGYYQALRAVPAGQAPATGSGSTWTTNLAYWAESQGSYSGAQWDAAASYAVGDVVYQPADGNYYQAHTAGTNHAPPNASFWGALTEFVRSIDVAQAGQTAIGLAQRCWDIDPRVCDPAALGNHEQRFDLFEAGLVVRGCAPVVWLRFWRAVPDFSGAVFDPTATYSAGQQIYFTDGDFWSCVSTTTAGQSPATTPAKWSRVEFPYALAQMVAQRVYGEMLKADGQADKGLVEIAAAGSPASGGGLWGMEVERVERQQGQGRQLRVLTR